MNELEPARDLALARLVAELDAIAHVRRAVEGDASTAEGRKSLREWQAARLARTHADLLASPKFRGAAQFFLADLYGPQDLGHREQAVRRVLPLMHKTLPAPALETIADALELDALSESLDVAMVGALGDIAIPIDPARYGAAYRAVGRAGDRARQIDLIRHLGQSLEQLTRARFVGATLGIMRKPAQLAGLGDLQAFLERGYDAFRQMGGAKEFIEIVAGREAAISAALFAGDDSPLS